MPKTQIVPLDFSSIAELDDGRINRVLQYHLQRCAADCVNRPNDKSKRKVTLDFTIEPVLDINGDLESARIEIECKSKVPVHRTKPYEALVDSKGFRINRDFPDSADQAPLFRDGDE